MVERRFGSEWKTRWKAPSRAAGDVGGVVQPKVHDPQPKLTGSQATWLAQQEGDKMQRTGYALAARSRLRVHHCGSSVLSMRAKQRALAQRRVCSG